MEERREHSKRIQLYIKVLELYDQNHPVKSIYFILRKSGIYVSKSVVYRIVHPFKRKYEVRREG